jgi:molybdopterin-guanine dinucleotide biosynthesis protein A
MREDRILGVLLAGGRGRRLGAGPKALAKVAGATLLERASATLEAACDEFVIVAPAGLGLRAPGGRRIVHDEGRGPLPALLAGLHAAPCDLALVLGVDFPLVRPATLAAIAARLGNAPAAVPRPGAMLQPLVAAYAPAARDALEAAAARRERALVAAVASIGPRVIEAEELEALPGGPAVFLNVNTPAELAEAARRLSSPVR